MLSREMERQWISPVACAGPPLDAGEQPLDTGAIAVNREAWRGAVIGKPRTVRLENRYQVFGAGQDVDVRLLRVAYWGRPLSVLRVMAGRERLQPKPKGPLPAPESYESESCGPKPERPGLVAMGTVSDPVPVTGLAANFSPMPRMAPPPLGSDILGASVCAVCVAVSCLVLPWVSIMVAPARGCAHLS